MRRRRRDIIDKVINLDDEANKNEIKEMVRKMGKEKCFRESYDALKKAVSAMKDDSVSLEDFIRLFGEAGVRHEECREIIESAKQKLKELDKDTGETTDLE